MEKIRNFLEDNDDLFWDLGADISCDIMDDESHYGCNFSGDKKVFELLFMGNSDCFPAIWIGDNEEEDKIEKLPVYWLDLSSEETEFELYAKKH